MSDTSAQQRPPYSPKSSPFLNEVRRVMRLKHMSRRTEASYLHYIVDFIRFYSKQHPREMGVGEIRAYLSHLAMDKDVAASTQNVALSALLFLYRRVLRVELPNIENIERARRPKRVPVVFTPAEVEAILAQLAGTHHLVISLLYGTGMRLSECLRLRVKDLDFEYRQITIRDGKGGTDRVTVLAEKLIPRLKLQLRSDKTLHEQDLSEGFGEVEMPHALARKYPNAARSWGWQYVFPAARRSKDPRSGRVGRHHILEDGIQRDEAGHAKSQHHQAWKLPYSAPQFRNPSARKRLRYQDRPGASGPQRRADDHDLYSRPQPRQQGSKEPTRHLAGMM